MKENEEHHIAAISADGYTITLQKPLKYQHISISQTFGTREVESRGEVGLLTRNIKIQGTMNQQFVEEIPACEEEFDSGGAFSDAMQTCFAGKFGEELGHDEFGSVIIISPKFKDQGLVEARIEYVEFENAGQAFRVGRYPIHFHLPGNMNTSYVRGNAVHHSNNRACTLHDVANMVVEKNVVYNVKGLSFFLEDGVELNNTLQYNLAMFTRMSNSLLNPDINPASFWIVNPWNRFRHNACAGGTHFCFWLRPANFPDGPSWTRRYCPKKVPFLEFTNNTAHSMGWYGFWIFGQSNHATYDPHDGTVDQGFCNGKRIQTTIGSFTTWNNKRGFEIVSGANIRLENQTHMDHDFAGYEIFTAKGPYGDGGPGIFNAVLVGHSQISDLTEGKENACMPGGIHVTDSGYTIKDTSFYNFDRTCYGMRIRLEEHGATSSAVRTEGLTFENSPNKVILPSGEDQGLWISDVDGTLTGTAGANLVGDSPTNPPACVPDSTGDLGEAHLGGHTGSVCPGSVKFHRITMDGAASPSSFRYNPTTVTNDNGNSSRPWGKMMNGWSSMLIEDTVNWITFDSVEHVTNISYTGSVSGMYGDDDNYVLIGHYFYQQPDRFTVLPGQKGINASDALTVYPTYDDNANGEWYYNNETAHNKTEMVYIISDKTTTGRKRRATSPVEEGSSAGSGWQDIDFKVYRCFYKDCLPPPPPTLPAGRPLDFHVWSDASAWESLGYSLPMSGDTVFIPPGSWFVMDVDPPPLKRIYLYGGLEIDDSADRKLDVEIIMIQGGMFQCGLPNAPYQHNFELILRGDHFTEDQPLPDGPNLGAKALGVFGFADMHGIDVGQTWTKLAATSSAGSNTLELVDAVTWAVGSEIVISTTSYELHETERRTIASISGNTITLTEALEFDHLGTEATLSDGSKYQMRAEVGILTRNVRVVGNDYKLIDKQQFGGRVLIGEFIQDDITYTGYGRFANVEFAVAGQEGWYDQWDPRYAIAFLDTGDHVNAGGKPQAKESYVKKCGFNYNYNSAIGVFGANNIPIEDNVIYKFINNGIFDEGDGNKITGNLVTKGESVARIKGQSKNPEFFACINIKRATNTILTDNVMAGCSNAGLYTIGSPSDITYAMSNNEAHGAAHGLHISSAGVSRVSSGTVIMKDFYSWMNYDYGVQTESENNVEFSNIVAIDNGAGFLPFMFGPSADSHKFEDKYFSMTDSVIVSVSDVYDCSKEDKPDIYKSSMDNGRRWSGRNSWIDGGRQSHHTGIIWPIFQSKARKITLPWHKPLVGAAGTNPALRGILHLSDVTFANFKENCGKEDVVFRTNYGVDDVNWPINATNIKFLDTVAKNKLYMDIPTLGKINPADCTDFDCDGFKKAIIFDQDGSVAEDGSKGTIIPDSAYEWDGIPVRGLGYYRIPKPMITTLNGDRIEYVDKMPNTGLYRDDSCVWNQDWRAYKCQNINHRLMIIESMDRDSKIRRLSPIAMLANPGPSGYIDLVNGPQDFSCCSGYTCAERLSTFFTMVATGIEYEVMFTSIPPQNFRIHMLHNDGGDAVRAKIWFPKQQRLDVYINGMLMNPNNLDFSSEKYNLLPPDDMYIPALTEPNGANYFDPGTGHLYLIVKGPSVISIKTQPIVVLKLGMTVPIENFFEENVVGNLAGLLGIDPANIRVTNIVREGSTGRRRRSGETITGVDFEIGPPPSDTLVEFIPEEYTNPPSTDVTENPAYTTTAAPESSTTAWVPPANHLSFDDLASVSATIANAFQTGSLGADMGLNVTGLAVEQPINPPEEPPAYTSPEERAQVLDVPYAEQKLTEDLALLEEMEVKALEVPGGINVGINPDGVLEALIMTTKPSIYVMDTKGKMLTDLGDPSDPWMCTVTLKAGAGTLGGNTTVPFIKGIAEFSDLFVSKMGSGYIMEFEVTYPAGTGLPAVEGIPFDVGPRPLGLRFHDEPLLRKENTTFDVFIKIWDEALNKPAGKNTLATFNWDCQIFLSTGQGNLTGSTNGTIAAGKNTGMFTDLILTDAGLNYDLQAECFSPEAGKTVTVRSAPFHVHDYPETGLLRKTATAFKYKGPFEQVAKVIKAYTNGIIEIETCKGCPAGINQKSVTAPPEKEVQIENWSPCDYPIFIGQEGGCEA